MVTRWISFSKSSTETKAAIIRHLTWPACISAAQPMKIEAIATVPSCDSQSNVYFSNYN